MTNIDYCPWCLSSDIEKTSKGIIRGPDTNKTCCHGCGKEGVAFIWQEILDLRESDAIRLLKRLPDERRESVFKNFCPHCGSENPSCQCWNDE